MLSERRAMGALRYLRPWRAICVLLRPLKRDVR